MGCLWTFLVYAVGLPILALGFGTWLLPIAYDIAVPEILSGCIAGGLIPAHLSYAMAFKLSLAEIVIFAPVILVKAGLTGMAADTYQ